MHLREAGETEAESSTPTSTEHLDEFALTLVETVSSNIFALGLFIQDAIGVEIPQSLFDLEEYVETSLNTQLIQRQPSDVVAGIEDIIAKNNIDAITDIYIPESLASISDAVNEYVQNDRHKIDPDTIADHITQIKADLNISAEEEPTPDIDQDDVEAGEDL
jgi:hypothetical protein